MTSLDPTEYTEASVVASRLTFSLLLGHIRVDRRSTSTYWDLWLIVGLSGALNVSVYFQTESGVLAEAGDCVTIASFTIPEDKDLTEFKVSVFNGKGFSVDHGEQVAVAIPASILGFVDIVLTTIVLYFQRRNAYSPDSYG